MPPTKKHARFSAHRRHPHLYEINTWVWLEVLSRAPGQTVRLAEVPDQEWDTLKERGFDIVWLMGVWERSPAGRRMSRTEVTLFPGYDEALPGWQMRDVVGSPYAVRCYQPDRRIGTWEDIDLVREKLHARGMKLMLDFVTNHTALDHPWVAAHPEYYVQGTHEDFRKNPTHFYLAEDADNSHFIAYGRDPYFEPWRDTAQLNYFHPGAREAFVGQLRSIAEHCDGVRCDMAMLALNEVFARTWSHLLAGQLKPAKEFWSEATSALPGFVWLAEVYWDLEWQMQQLGFQFAYDKRLYDRLLHVVPGEVRRHLCAERRYQEGLARFLENHDEPRSAAEFGFERLPALATLVATLPGMRFYHQGQFEGCKLRPRVQLRAAAPEVPHEGLRAFYEKILRITDNPVFHEGEWQLLEMTAAGDSSVENMIAYGWRLAEGLRVVVVNLADGEALGYVQMAGGINPTREYVLKDLLNDATYEWDGAALEKHGLFVRLRGHRAHVFDVKAR